MKRQIATLLITLLTISCNMNKGDFITKIEEQYETIEGREQIASQTITTLRVSDSLPISILTKVSNYSNDYRVQYLTELSKENELQDYLQDSIYYDKFANDTLKKSFVYLDNRWQLTQIFHKKFRADKQVSYFMTERPFEKNSYFKKEIFYTYNSSGKVLTETEVECLQRTDCDSIFKKEYVYDVTGKLDSTNSYIWINDEWSRFKKKNSY